MKPAVNHRDIFRSRLVVRTSLDVLLTACQRGICYG